jgi:hypothetical protein
MSGQLLMKGVFNGLHNTLSVEHLNAGNYMLVVKQDIQIKTIKFSKVN